MEYLNLQTIHQLINNVISIYNLNNNHQNIDSKYKIQDLQHPQTLRKLAEKINTRMIKNIFKTNDNQLSQDIPHKNWVLGQYKLFKSILIYYSINYSIQITQMKNQQISQIKSIFKYKSPIFIDYQIASIIRLEHKVSLPWAQQQIKLLKQIMKNNKQQNWKQISIELYQLSCQKYLRLFSQCRQQWNNHLNPLISKQQWTIQQDLLLLKIASKVGLKWSIISKKMNGNRNQHMVKNRYNSFIRKFINKNRKINKNAQLAIILHKITNKARIQTSNQSDLSNTQISNQVQEIERVEQQLQAPIQHSVKQQNISTSSDQNCLMNEQDEFCIQKYLNFESIHNF